MSLFSFYAMLVVTVSMVMMCLGYSFHWTSSPQAKSSLEAGFHAIAILGGFSVQFIFITLLFLLFDLEILLLLSWMFYTLTLKSVMVVWIFLIGSWWAELMWNKLEWQL